MLFLALLIARASADECTDEFDKVCPSPRDPDACAQCYYEHRLQLFRCQSEEIQKICKSIPPPAPTPIPSPSGKRPQNAQNITLYGLRPYEIPGLEDKDTADIAGDIYFWIADKVLLPYTCRKDPQWPLCESAKLIADNQVYEKTIVEIDSKNTGKYALCNPSTYDPSGHTWHCSPSEPVFGAGNVNTMYGNCTVIYHGQTYDQCKGQQFMEWRVAAANHFPGNWYSTQATGDCDNTVTGEGCYWRVVENVKTVNATCVNGQISSLVEVTGESCFNNCGADAKNITSDCYIECFMTTVLGDNNTGTKGIDASKITGIMDQAFKSDDISEGGCPALPPYQPPSNAKIADPTMVCSVCNHIYDPAADGGGKAFGDLPDTWKCPVCAAPKSAYKPQVMVDGTQKWSH